ncbi:8160_t:CDS:1, partial [Racocetra fulgida]
MTRGQRNPEITIRRNGVPNYIKFIKNSYPFEEAFPVQENYLREYLAYLAQK